MRHKPADDGHTHVNIYSRGHTPLGRWMSNFAETPFMHPEDGPFKSVEGYWYWLTTGDDHLRELVGLEAKLYGRDLPVMKVLGPAEFQRKIRLALEAKCAAYPEHLAQLRRVPKEKPLTHYYMIRGQTRMSPKEHAWLVDLWEDIRRAPEKDIRKGGGANG